MHNPTVLLVENIAKKYGKTTIINNINLTVRAGEIIGLLGPNGAGKTTTFNCISGILKPNSGKISLLGVDITKDYIHSRAQRGMCLLPQQTSIFRNLTVAGNILVALQASQDNKQKLSPQQLDEKVEALLSAQKLLDKKNHLATQLSGGQKRRLEIARALATNPKIILLDEPFAGIDPISIESLTAQFKMIAASGIALLITDHNIRETLAICDRNYVITDGEIIFAGTSQDLLENDFIKSRYLGNNFSI